ncbi:unnamed protein product [Pedinophyceae sp. YPF-701]|nr:unnamed protein product [Pedinophyceae sp. YPF-701]
MRGRAGGQLRRVLSVFRAADHRRSVWTGRDGRTHFKGSGPRWQDPERVRFYLGASAAAVALYGAFCYKNSQVVPYSGRSHVVMTSPRTDAYLGDRAAVQIVAQARQRGALLPPHHKLSMLVQRVGEALTRVVEEGARKGEGGGFQEHLASVQWRFYVIDEPVANAFATAGGSVVIYTGLINLMQNVDDLAAVMAHELAHIVARHSGERMTRSLMSMPAQIFISLGAGLPPGFGSVFLELPQSRQNEMEADSIGLQIMSKACFDPAAMGRVFAALDIAAKKSMGGTPPKLLSTHPPSKDRVKAAAEQAPSSLPLTQNARCFDFRRRLGLTPIGDVTGALPGW